MTGSASADGGGGGGDGCAPSFARSPDWESNGIRSHRPWHVRHVRQYLCLLPASIKLDTSCWHSLNIFCALPFIVLSPILAPITHVTPCCRCAGTDLAEASINRPKPPSSAPPEQEAPKTAAGTRPPRPLSGSGHELAPSLQDRGRAAMHCRCRWRAACQEVHALFELGGRKELTRSVAELSLVGPR